MLDVRHLARLAPDGRRLFDEIDLAVAKGGNVLVTGPSGSGKSQLLKVLAGTERPARGRVRVGGHRLWPGEGALGLGGRVKMGYASASGGLLSNLTLWDNVALPLRFAGVPEGELRPRVDAALAQLALTKLANVRPHAVRLSTRKHGDLARVLAMAPEVILLDDPMGGHDAADKILVLDLIRRWSTDSACTLVIAAEDLHPFDFIAAERLQLRRPGATRELS